MSSKDNILKMSYDATQTIMLKSTLKNVGVGDLSAPWCVVKVLGTLEYVYEEEAQCVETCK